MGPEVVDYTEAAAYLGAAFVMAIGGIGPALGQGFIGAKACENIGKYPENWANIRNTMLIAMGVVETTGIASFLIALMLIFKK